MFRFGRPHEPLPINFNNSGIRFPHPNPFFNQASCYLLHWQNPRPFVIVSSGKPIKTYHEGLYKVGFTTRPISKRVEE
ncbi:MAG: hypothetical protein AAFQ07_07250, partial [Chloroflexota bacterium]